MEQFLGIALILGTLMALVCWPRQFGRVLWVATKVLACIIFFPLAIAFIVSFCGSTGPTGASANGFNTPQRGVNIQTRKRGVVTYYVAIDSQGREGVIPEHAYARYNLPDPMAHVKGR